METTYPERAASMTRDVRNEAFAAAAIHFSNVRMANSSIGELRIKRLNEIRAAGMMINMGSGRGQLLFSVEGREFCRKEIMPHMPKGISMESVHASVLIAKKMTADANTVEEVDSLEKLLQAEFEILGLIQPSRRKEIQNAHARNLFSDFVSKALGIKTLCDDLEKEEPMESWPAYKLDDFLSSAQPIVERFERAKKLRLQ